MVTESRFTRSGANRSVIKDTIIEEEQRRAAKNGGRNPLAAFFSRIQADVSKSLER